MIKLVAFDWNGTMIADTQACLHADNKVLAHFNLEQITYRRMCETFDIPISKFWTNLGYELSFFEKNASTIGKVFLEHYNEGVRNVRTRVGLNPLLSWLTETNINSVIFSNHIKEDIESHLARLKIQKHIQAVLARHNGDTTQLHKRSKEQKLQDYITKAKLKPHEVITIGDTPEEIEIGKTLGLHTVALLGGQCTRQRLVNESPDYLIGSMSQLKTIIEGLQ